VNDKEGGPAYKEMEVVLCEFTERLPLPLQHSAVQSSESYQTTTQEEHKLYGQARYYCQEAAEEVGNKLPLLLLLGGGIV